MVAVSVEADEVDEEPVVAELVAEAEEGIDGETCSVEEVDDPEGDEEDEGLIEVATGVDVSCILVEALSSVPLTPTD
jgi:hypothetical protein